MVTAVRFGMLAPAIAALLLLTACTPSANAGALPGDLLIFVNTSKSLLVGRT